MLDLGCGTGELARHLAATGLAGDRLRHLAEHAAPRPPRPIPAARSEWVRLDPGWQTLPFAVGQLRRGGRGERAGVRRLPRRRAGRVRPRAAPGRRSCCARSRISPTRSAGWNGVAAAVARLPAVRRRGASLARLGALPDLPADLAAAALGRLVGAGRRSGRAADRSPPGRGRALAAAPVHLPAARDATGTGEPRDRDGDRGHRRGADGRRRPVRGRAARLPGPHRPRGRPGHRRRRGTSVQPGCCGGRWSSRSGAPAGSRSTTSASSARAASGGRCCATPCTS